MKLRRVTDHDIPRSVGYQHGPSQVIFARKPNGQVYFDLERDQTATVRSWFGFTTQPTPYNLRDDR